MTNVVSKSISAEFSVYANEINDNLVLPSLVPEHTYCRAHHCGTSPQS